MTMGDRKRIKKVNEIVVIDPEAYRFNSCSKNAKPEKIFGHKIYTDVWTEKHYNIRLFQGEDDGQKRDGIDLDLVLNLISETFPHVLVYALKVGKIVNFPPFVANQSTRIVLQNLVDAGHHFLNVAVEYHYLDMDTYEVTVWTAMNEKNFNIREGQYVVQLHHDRTILHQKIKGSFVQVFDVLRK